MHALIIDDDVNNLEVLAGLLEDAGLGNTAVQDPTKLNQALASAGQIDVVFLDLEMPGLNGYEVLKYLKTDAGLNAPVVACTVHLSEAVNAHELGFDGFIGKPLDGARFPDQIKRILNGETVWEAR